MTTLYEIQTQYRELMSEMEAILADPNPETLESDMDHLNRLMGINAQDFQAKGDAYAAVVREKEARAESLRDEADRMVQLAKREEATAEYLKGRLFAAMQEQGIASADLPHFRLSLRKSQAVDVTDKDALPQGYLRIKTVTEPDKTALKVALKQGQAIPGAVLVDRQSLQIK